MRVLYFTRNYSVHDRRFLEALAGTEHAVAYMPLLSTGFEQARDELPKKVKIEPPLHRSESIHWWQAFSLLNRFRTRIRRSEPEIIHAGPVHLGALLAAAAGAHPLVTMSWGSDLLWAARKPWVAIAARYALGKSDAFVGDCNAVKNAAVRFGMSEERIVLFPWGTDIHHFSPGSGNQIRSDLGWEDGFILISTRSFEPLYGVELIIKAFIKAAPMNPSLRLLLLGHGSLEARFKTSISTAGLSERVHFAGHISSEALPEYYRAADIYLSASYSDGSSVSLLEAMSSGLPAIVSDIPGNQEWVEHGFNGWQFRSGDVDSLIDRIIDVVDHQELLGPAGDVARNIAEERADWRENFPKLLHSYEFAREYASLEIQ